MKGDLIMDEQKYFSIEYRKLSMDINPFPLDWHNVPVIIASPYYNEEW